MAVEKMAAQGAYASVALVLVLLEYCNFRANVSNFVS